MNRNLRTMDLDLSARAPGRFRCDADDRSGCGQNQVREWAGVSDPHAAVGKFDKFAWHGIFSEKAKAIRDYSASPASSRHHRNCSERTKETLNDP